MVEWISRELKEQIKECSCDPLNAKSCSLWVKEGTTTHKSNRMRTVYYNENCHRR